MNSIIIVFTHIYICTTYFLYHICRVFMRFTFFCNCRIPYSKASAVGGHPETKFFINLNVWNTGCNLGGLVAGF